MDVSEAVDTLFAGVVPERLDELKTLWGQHEQRVRLLDTHRFLLQQLYATVQISELALRQIWLTGYAAWAAVDAFNVPLTVASTSRGRIDTKAWRRDAAFAEAEIRFARLFAAIGGIAEAESIDLFAWPEGVPYPHEGLAIEDAELKAPFDLICMAGAYVFAHEVRHNLFETEANAPPDLLEEERECDRWALALMLDEAAPFARANGWAPELVRAKRVLGVMVANLVIVALTPRESWDGPDRHPPVRERVRHVLDAALDPVPPWFWTTVASMLLGFARQSGVIVDSTPVPFDMRELAYDLCERLRPAQ
jgi:hypothetical protein